jgi:hypothetical protein
MKRQKLGVIGWLYHYDNEYALTTAACDARQENLDRFHAQYPKPALYRDYRKMAEEAQLDAVIEDSQKIAVDYSLPGSNSILR